MSLFLPNIPQGPDNLDFSQGELLSNNQGLDTVFGIDHYKFSDATANKGFHNHVTTPAIIGGHPITAANLPLIYAATAGNLGVIQFSKGPNLSAATPSNPITMLQSPDTGQPIGTGTTIDVFDFTGLPRAMCILTASNNTIGGGNPPAVVSVFAYIFWTGAPLNTLGVANIISSSPLAAFSATPKLQLKNTSAFNLTDVYWTLQFMRVQ